MIVDVHVHLFPEDVRRGRERFRRRDSAFEAIYGDPRARMASPQEVLEALDEAGAWGAVALGFPWEDVSICRDHNDYILEACRASGGRLVGLGCVSPTSGEGGVREAERSLKMGLMGIGEVAAYGHAGGNLNSPFFIELTGLLRHWKRPLLLHATESVGHTYPGKDRTDLRDLYQWILANQDLDIILAHWGGGLFFYELMPEVQRACQRVYYDTAASPFLYRPQIYSIALDIVGRDRLLLGSDFPLIPPGRYIQEIRQEEIPGEATEGLLGKNAARLFQWAQTP
jgi:predicted TIM-barrel fold metal-dependent hydrolase